jgi:hypothetical protein
MDFMMKYFMWVDTCGNDRSNLFYKMVTSHKDVLDDGDHT